MHKKISVGASISIAIAAVIIAVIATCAVTMNIYNNIVSDVPQRESMYNSLSMVDSIIRKNYLGAIEEESLNSSLAKGYAESLSVGKNYYLTKEEYDAYKIELSGLNKDGSNVNSIKYQKYGGAGYVKILNFTDRTPDEFDGAIKLLLDNSITGLVIDVRDNMSFNINSAAKVIDRIVPLASEGTGSIATAYDKDNKKLEVWAADSESVDLPVSVIINEKTLGAGELLACDIRDFGKGAIVGKMSAGDGTYKKTFELSDGSALLITVANIIPYTSENYDKIGIKPDYDVEPDKNENKKGLSNDKQFLSAYASLSS